MIHCSEITSVTVTMRYARMTLAVSGQIIYGLFYFQKRHAKPTVSQRLLMYMFRRNDDCNLKLSNLELIGNEEKNTILF